MKIGIVFNQPLPFDKEDRKAVIEAVKDVSEALDELGWRKTLIPVKDGGDIPALIKTAKEVDCVINLCEDFEGKNEGEAWVAGLLEMLKKPYTGSSPEALMLALNKARSKEVYLARKIPTPYYLVIESPPRGYMPLKFPVIIKPARGDGSTGIKRENVAHDMDGLYKRSKELLTNYPSLLIEEFINGKELSAAILDGEVLALGEVFFTDEPEVLTYDAKWHKGSHEYNANRVMYTTDFRGKEDAAALALRAFKALGLRDYGRVDMRLDKDNKPYVIDVNPNPDISSEGSFSKALKAADIPYNDFIINLITWAMERAGVGSKKEFARWMR